MKHFIKARLKLTFYYSLVLLVVSFFLSSLYYQQTVGAIQLHSQRINQRLEQGFSGPMRGQRSHATVVQSELEEARVQILNRLIVINAVLLILGAGASYFLSGLTLRPIKKSLVVQKQFTADAAHELKTPLTALETSLEVSLMDKKLPKRATDVLQDNLVATKSLVALTESLLSLARAESNNQPLFSEVSLGEVVEQAIEQLKPLADKKKIKLEWGQGEGLDQAFIKGDRVSLLKAVIILVDNAIKYSPSGSSVKLHLEQSGKHVLLKVVDQGPGIPQAEQENIFKRFYRLEQARTKDGVGGYGLGLAVAKKITESHGGQINLESEVGLGSKFILKFRVLTA